MTLIVIEPHLSTPKNPVAVGYLAFPAAAALSAALGHDWQTKAKAIEFGALDGYVSRIEVARLTSGKAYFAFARADRSPFTVDNRTQNEKNLRLGPYYLVWHNRDDPSLLAEGARNWPYQIDAVSLFNASDARLHIPRGSTPRWSRASQTRERIVSPATKSTATAVKKSAGISPSSPAR